MADSSVLSVIYPADAGEVAVFAAHGLAESLSVMLGARWRRSRSPRAPPPPLSLRGRICGWSGVGPLGPTRSNRRASSGAAPSGRGTGRSPAKDGFVLRREAVAARGGMQQGALVLHGSTERALLHGGYWLLERLGAVFPLIGTARLPRIGADSLEAIKISASSRRLRGGPSLPTS